MHSYATDVDRSKITLVLGAGSVGIAYLLYWAIHAASVAAPWWIDIPGPLGIAALLYAIYDRAAWRWRFGLLRLSTIPDLSGIWEGSVKSDFDNGANVQTGLLRISQHWTTIRVRYEPTTGSSWSASVVAAVLTDEDEPTLVYEYTNEPRTFAAAAMTPHRGLARLQITSDGGLAQGITTQAVCGRRLARWSSIGGEAHKHLRTRRGSAWPVRQEYQTGQSSCESGTPRDRA